ncbi:MAG: TIGR00282 family metallophosphoesterase [Ruminococcaceae bacterium]|nr:TIGR00282 family metallophosphoesterase [Oscillospiraceae bacterium]
MIYRILAIGDVVGEQGLEHLRRHLRSVKKMKDIHFTVVNGENASGVGIMPQQVEELYMAGADVVTLGNHTFGKMQIQTRLEEDAYLLRPANYTSRAPGRGYGIYDCGRVQIGVMNLIGRCDLDFHAENPFATADRLLKEEKPRFVLVDFHAEATSEKLALGYYLDGRVSALWGTHTHVPTADEQIMPKGTGYITDLGMTGPVTGVLGIRHQQSIESFLGGQPGRYQVADGPCKMQGAVFSLDSDTGLCTAVERIDIR